jgi:hypothetical protein
MNQTSQRQCWQRFLGRALAPLAGALIVLGFAGNAHAAPDEEMPQGRLGYRWVDAPPARKMTDADQLGLEIAKYGGGSLVAVWLLRKMFSAE